MWDAISTRTPASLLALIHEAGYRGASYALLLALTALLSSVISSAPAADRIR